MYKVPQTGGPRVLDATGRTASVPRKTRGRSDNLESSLSSEGEASWGGLASGWPGE
ncbi:Protein of unknown function [Pyronema omphalodes CBS 100304]|uniref:Uncharacterized protein n=1 Tax=Pyronema omphalodes (strain CBS 100304) TaxID=1076935 RepID=U4LE33_PYROM|nr:Protein of unknown function [Pyronema omphalodes CBS 100304]